MRAPASLGHRVVAIVCVALAGVLLAGCMTTSAPKPSATASTSAVPDATASPSASAAPATYLPDGSAEDNKDLFDATNEKLLAANGSPTGRQIIDNLVAAGFTKAAMQVTPDKTSINGTVDSILFSVKIGADCLLGQHGGGGYSSAVEPALSSGVCLIGKTRPIDW